MKEYTISSEEFLEIINGVETLSFNVNLLLKHLYKGFKPNNRPMIHHVKKVKWTSDQSNVELFTLNCLDCAESIINTNNEKEIDSALKVFKKLYKE